MHLNNRDGKKTLALAVTLVLTLAATALADKAMRIFELHHSGGYRDPNAPDPALYARVYSDGRFECHCFDYSLKSTQLSAEEQARLKTVILESGFFDLRGGLSRWSAWWYGWQCDSGVVTIFARRGKKKKTIRATHCWQKKMSPEIEQVYSRLRRVVKPWRARACPGETPDPEQVEPKRQEKAGLSATWRWNSVRP